MTAIIEFLQWIYYLTLSMFWTEDKSRQSFRNLLQNSDKILIIAPLDESAAKSITVVIKRFVENGKKVTVLVSHASRGSYPNDHRLTYEEFYKADTLFNLFPKLSFLKKLKALTFDLVIDLNINGEGINPILSMPVNAKVKAGICKKNFEKAYSIRLEKMSGEKQTIPQNCVDLLFRL